MEIKITECDLNNPLHQQKLSDLTAAYMLDPMGGGEKMSERIKEDLPRILSEFPNKLILFALADDVYVGICTAFINISTFYARPYFNVHDIAVLPEYRGIGIGKRLLEKIIEIARERNYCKITLEVRYDNFSAQSLYRQLGFTDTEPPMFFWTKWL